MGETDFGYYYLFGLRHVVFWSDINDYFFRTSVSHS
jgi:hypothetical protein